MERPLDESPYEGEVDGLTVIVERARRLLPMDKSRRGGGDADSSDPYAKLEFVDAAGEGSRHRSIVATQVVQGSLRPRWYEDAPGRCTHLVSVRRGDTLLLTVWDRDALSDDLIGGAELPTARCRSPGTKWSGWLQLHTGVGSFRGAGSTLTASCGGGGGGGKPRKSTSLGRKAGELFVTLAWSGLPEKRAAALRPASSAAAPAGTDVAHAAAAADDGADDDEEALPRATIVDAALLLGGAERARHTPPTGKGTAPAMVAMRTTTDGCRR
jgi:hypothetical protein